MASVSLLVLLCMHSEARQVKTRQAAGMSQVAAVWKFMPARQMPSHNSNRGVKNNKADGQLGLRWGNKAACLNARGSREVVPPMMGPIDVDFLAAGVAGVLVAATLAPLAWSSCSLVRSAKPLQPQNQHA